MHRAYCKYIMPGLHQQRNRGKSLKINDGCVGGGGRLLRQLSCRWSPGITDSLNSLNLYDFFKYFPRYL